MAEEITHQFATETGDTINIVVSVSSDKVKQPELPPLLPNGRRKPMVTFTVDQEVEEAISRDAYWSRKNKSQLVNAILKKHYEGKTLKPIPNDSESEE